MSKWTTLAELDHPGDAIRERRIALGWTQAELAECSGVSQADISRMNTLGWQPRFDLEAGLKRTIELEFSK